MVEALLVLPSTIAVLSVHIDNFSAYSIQTYPCINQQRTLTISPHLFVVMGDHRHTLQTHTGLMSMVLSLKLLIWFHPFKQRTYIPILWLALWRSYRHINTDRFTPPHLLFRTSSPTLLTNKFNKTLILTNYLLLSKCILSLFLFVHTHICTLPTHWLLCTVDLKPWALPSIPTML